MISGPDAARRRFPHSAHVIETLVRVDEDFRDLCNDLAAAEAALITVNELSPDLRGIRLAECNDWVESLSAEIEDALLKAKVVPMPMRPTR